MTSDPAWVERAPAEALAQMGAPYWKTNSRSRQDMAMKQVAKQGINFATKDLGAAHPMRRGPRATSANPTPNSAGGPMLPAR